MRKLTVYKSMRDTNKTPEPFTSIEVIPSEFVFVVQKHRATRLHYDFRLEFDGVMLSWAVPKGPSLDSRVKRLAMQTEDHPLDYRKFSGVIPEGEYGAGLVEIWDEGTYYPETEVSKGERVQVKSKGDGQKVIRKGLEKSELKFFLNGKKLKGSFALIKINGFGGKNSWLLIKHHDEFVQYGYDAKNS